MGNEGIHKVIVDYQSDPHNADKAKKALTTISYFSAIDAGKGLADQLRDVFSEDADMQLFLGGFYEQLDFSKEAEECYRSAYDIAPEHPFVQRIMAMILLNKEQRAAAENLLKCMEIPGRHRDWHCLATLAESYEESKQPEAALRVYSNLCRIFPGPASTNHHLRRSITKLEHSINASESCLPPRECNWRRRAIITAAALFIPALLILSDLYMRRHRTVYVTYNGSKPALIETRNEEILLTPHSLSAINLPEGTYSLKVRCDGFLTKNISISIPSSLRDRWLGGKIYIVNPFSSAVIITQTKSYSSANPGSPTEEKKRYLIGTPFITLDDIDYVFKNPPPFVTADSWDGEVTTRSCIMIQTSPAEFAAFAVTNDEISPTDLMTFLETHMQLSPTNTLLPQLYHSASLQAKEPKRAYEFIRKRLNFRPVNIGVHNVYRQQAETFISPSDLKKKYDQLIKNEPQNSILLYLRGNLCIRARHAFRFFAEAVKQSPENSYSWNGMAYYFLSMGEISKARQAALRSIGNTPTNAPAQQIFYKTLLASEDYDIVRKLLANSIHSNPTNPELYIQKMFVEKAAGNEEAAEDAIDAHTRMCGSFGRSRDNELWRGKYFFYYSRKDYISAERCAQNISNESLRNRLLARLAIESREFEKAKALLESENCSPYDCLAFIIAFGKENPEIRKSFLQQVVEQLKAGNQVSREIAALLQTDREVYEQLLDLLIPPENKRILALYFAMEPSEEQGKLIKLAETLNFDLTFPHHLIKQEIKKY